MIRTQSVSHIYNNAHLLNILIIISNVKVDISVNSTELNGGSIIHPEIRNPEFNPESQLFT